MKKENEEEKFEPVEVEQSPKLNVAITLIREKVCQATGLSPEEVKGREIIISKDSVVIK